MPLTMRLVRGPQHEQRAREAEDDAAAAEDVARLRRPDGEELDGQEVEQDLERPSDAVLAAAGGPRMVAHGDLGDPSTRQVRERRQETVHLAVQPRLHDVRTVGLGAAVVVEAHTRDAADEPVGDPRRHAANPVLGDAASRSRRRSPRRSSRAAGDVGRIVLEVAVHRDDHLAARVVEPGGHRRGLPVVAAQLNHPQSFIVGGQMG